MRFVITLIFVVVSSVAIANMASPIQRSANLTNAISSKDIRINSEDLFINISNNFKEANFTVIYNIETERDGVQIPLLFVALYGNDSFKLMLDDRPIDLLKENMTEIDFRNYLGDKEWAKKDTVLIRWNDSISRNYKRNDLLFFKVNLAKGKHTIKVVYKANVSSDRSDWIRKYFFEYDFAPAKYWKSFGELNININYAGNWNEVASNLGIAFDSTATVKTWKFKGFPKKELKITREPQISATAKRYIKLGLGGVILILTSIAALIHLFLVLWYRRKNIYEKYNVVNIAGAFLVTIVYGYTVWSGYDIIDNKIGEHASDFHGYGQLFLLLTIPIFYPIHLLICYVFDLVYAKMLRRKYPIDNRG